MYYKDETLKKELIAMISYNLNARTLAKRIGVSQGYLSDVLSGKRGLSEKIRNFLGYRTVIVKDKSTKKQE